MFERLRSGTADEESIRARREHWWRSAFFILGAVYIGLLLIGLLVDILEGFAQIVAVLFVAWLLAFVLSPLVNAIAERTRLSRGVAVGLVYAATLAVSGFVLFYAVSSIGSSAAEMSDEIPLIRERVEKRIGVWQDAISFGRFQPDLVTLYQDAEATVTDVATSVVGEVPQVTLAVLGSLVLVVILSMYMVADSNGIVSRLKRIPPHRWEAEVDILERNVTKAFGGFLRAQVILAGIQAAMTLVLVVLVGLPYGFVIVAAATLLMLVPFFGPPLALIPPIAGMAIFDPEWILVAAPLLLVVQTVVVNWLQPRLMHEALGMHPILVLVGLLIGAQIAGVWGALFGIPVLAVVNTFFRYLVDLRTIEESPDDLEEAIEEARLEAPEATHEELVAMAADRVDEGAGDEEADEEADGAVDRTQLDEAAGELRGAAADLRRTVDRLEERGRDRGPQD